MSIVPDPNSSDQFNTQWEYFYLSRAEWHERMIAKCGYRWKLLFTPNAWRQYHREQQLAIQEVLNELGGQGWELVGLLPLTFSIFGSGGSIGADAIFKRPLRDFR